MLCIRSVKDFLDDQEKGLIVQIVEEFIGTNLMECIIGMNLK